jgi:hypothetical protein
MRTMARQMQATAPHDQKLAASILKVRKRSLTS